MDATHLISLALGSSWASGINLYAALVTFGLLGVTGALHLPPGWELLMNPLVIAASGLMYMVEFTADKVPGGDSVWDAIHTFIRIPAGAVLAFSSVYHVDPALAMAAGIVGGTVSAANHSTKAGLRLAINTSPEPFSNWAMSVTEDGLVFSGVLISAFHPAVFIFLAVTWLLLLIWILPKIWRFVGTVFRKAKSLVKNGVVKTPADTAHGKPVNAVPKSNFVPLVQKEIRRTPAVHANESVGPLTVQVMLDNKWHDLESYSDGMSQFDMSVIADKLISSGRTKRIRFVHSIKDNVTNTVGYKVVFSKS